VFLIEAVALHLIVYIPYEEAQELDDEFHRLSAEIRGIIEKVVETIG